MLLFKISIMIDQRTHFCGRNFKVLSFHFDPCHYFWINQNYSHELTKTKTMNVFLNLIVICKLNRNYLPVKCKIAQINYVFFNYLKLMRNLWEHSNNFRNSFQIVIISKIQIQVQKTSKTCYYMVLCKFYSICNCWLFSCTNNRALRVAVRAIIKH